MEIQRNSQIQRRRKRTTIRNLQIRFSTTVETHRFWSWNPDRDPLAHSKLGPRRRVHKSGHLGHKSTTISYSSNKRGTT
eukprot:6190431-Pleurochrysis_carterae.AAC.1